MQQYSLKRGFPPDKERILGVLKECFPANVEEKEGKYLMCYGALSEIYVWIEGKKLCVETKSNLSADSAAVLDTNKRFRVFLEKATGYTAKKRLEMAKKEVMGK